MANQLPDIKEILINTFQKLINQFTEFVSNFINSGIILIIGWLVAKGVFLIVKNLLTKIGFDKVGDKINEIEAIKKFNLDLKLSVITAKIIYYFIFLAFVTEAANKLGVPAIASIISLLVNFIPKLLSAVIMMLVGILLADGLRKFVANLCLSFNIAAGKLISSAVFFMILIIIVIAALGQAGINTSLLESSFNLLIGGIMFAFAIGYGLASKEMLHNILASFYTKNKFKEGQVIEIEGVKGEIILMDNTNITLKTGDTKTIFPLQALQTKKVIVY